MMDDAVLFSLHPPLVEHMSHTRQEMCAIMNEAPSETLTIINLIRERGIVHTFTKSVMLVMMKVLFIATERHPVNSG